MYDENLRIVSDWKWYIQAIGLNNESVKYVNLDVTCFDMTGVSSSNSDLEKQERRRVLEELIPANILADYDAQWRNIDQAARINKYSLTRWFFWFVERVIFKIQKHVFNRYTPL